MYVRDSKEIVVVSFVSREATRPQGPSRANVWDHAKGYLVAPCGKNIHTLFVGEKERPFHDKQEYGWNNISKLSQWTGQG